MSPSVVYAAGVGQGSPSHRPKQTVKPLVELLGTQATFNDTFLKGNGEAMMAHALRQTGIVLISWEHTLIRGLIEHVRSPPRGVPDHWPEDRFDIVWILDAKDGGWAFSQRPQMLLAGDRDTPIGA